MAAETLEVLPPAKSPALAAEPAVENAPSPALSRLRIAPDPPEPTNTPTWVEEYNELRQAALADPQHPYRLRIWIRRGGYTKDHYRFLTSTRAEQYDELELLAREGLSRAREQPQDYYQGRHRSNQRRNWLPSWYRPKHRAGKKEALRSTGIVASIGAVGIVGLVLFAGNKDSSHRDVSNLRVPDNPVAWCLSHPEMANAAMHGCIEMPEWHSPLTSDVTAPHKQMQTAQKVIPATPKQKVGLPKTVQLGHSGDTVWGQIASLHVGKAHLPAAEVPKAVQLTLAANGHMTEWRAEHLPVGQRIVVPAAIAHLLQYHIEDDDAA